MTFLIAYPPRLHSETERRSSYYNVNIYMCVKFVQSFLFPSYSHYVQMFHRFHSQAFFGILDLWQDSRRERRGLKPLFRIRQEIRVETALLTPLGLNLFHPYCDYFSKRQAWTEEDLAVSETINQDFILPVRLLVLGPVRISEKKYKNKRFGSA